MPDSKKVEVNYTPEMIAIVEAAAPLTLETAKSVGEKIGRSYRSVIAKAKSLGLEYIAKPAPAKKEKGPTKLERVAEIESATGLKLDGLEKAPVATLTRLQGFVEALPESDS